MVPLAAILLGRMLPLPVAIPAFGIVMILTGFTVWAASSFRQSTPATARASAKDVAGMLVLIGCAATIMTDGELALRAFDSLLANGAGPALQADGAGFQKS